MARLSRTIFALVMAGAVAVRADDPSSARLALDSAERQLTGASNDAIAARRDLDYALTNQRQAADAARNAASALDQLRLVLDDPAAVDRALTAARLAAQTAESRSADLRRSEARLDSAAGAVEQYRTQARTNFEGNQVFAQALRQFEAAQDRLDNRTDWSLWLLDNDRDYQQLASLAALFHARVQFLRDQGGSDTQALARASQSWIDAENQVSEYEQWWLENDAQVAAARTVLAQARQQYDGIQGRFNVELSNDPRLLELMGIRDAEQRAAATAAAQFEEARTREQAARADAAAMQQRLAGASQQYLQIQSELASTYSALDQAASSVGSADRRLRDVLDRQDRAAMERDRAFRDFRRAQDDALRLRDEQNRIVRDRDNTNTADASANRDRDRERRTQEFENGRAPTIVIPPTPASPPQMISHPLPPPAREPAAPPGSPRVDEDRQAEQRRQQDQQRRDSEAAEAQRQRIEDASRRSSDPPPPSRITDDVRDRSPGTYRPAAGSNR